MRTPANKKNKNVAATEQEKSNEKKLVQARLPFKILSTPSTGATEGVVSSEESTEARKRKLSYDDEESDKTPKIQQPTKRRSVKKGKKEVNVKKRKEIINDSASKKAVVANVVLSDSDDDKSSDDDDGDDNVFTCKENLHKAAKQKTSSKADESSDMLSDDVDLIESSDESEEVKVVEAETPKSATRKNSINEIPKATPLSSKKSTPKDTRKSATPQSANKSTGKAGRNSTGDNKTTPKLQIKLPINNKKNKKRKQGIKVADTTADPDQIMIDELSDDVEIISKELHPEKRPKLDVTVDDEKKDDAEKSKASPKSKEPEKQKKLPFAVMKSSDKKEESTKTVKETEQEPMGNTEVGKKLETRSNSSSTITAATKVKEQQQVNDSASEDAENKSTIQEISSISSESEANTEATINSERTQETETEKNTSIASESKSKSISKVTNESGSNNKEKKNLTPKQQKLMERRLKAREEKERKIQEERLNKQREKEERELAKKREREEKEEQRRKDREEKEDQRRKEREEKERKRLAEIEAKNEEKRKRTEAKEEEQRKKEEERKRKEQEKEEAEMKKKKAALAFTKFFSRASVEPNGQRAVEEDDTEENLDLLAFRPFQIKGDMSLAPIVRKRLSDEERERLEKALQDEMPSKLYLDELRNGTLKPYKWSRPVQNENEAIVSKMDTVDDDNDNDVMIIEDELESAGQAIVEEPSAPIERHRAKFYKFAENRRPPYFGTWRKKTKVITARRPFAQDKKFFDYEVDSDDEWEEEEPGESLDGSDDDKEKESEDDDYEVDNEWFVPHGHLSEEEMQNEDDLGENNDREAQKAKLQLLQQEFAQEMKKKTEKIKPRLIGCIWIDENGNQPELCPKIIWDTLNVRAILCAEPPIMEETKSNSEKEGESTSANGERVNSDIKLKPITLTESMLKELVRLVHGNTRSKAFLVNEFIAHIEAEEESVRNGDVCVPFKTTVRDKIEEFAEWQVVERKSNNNANAKNGKPAKIKKKLCWIVSKDILQRMNMENIGLHNNWTYILTPKVRPKHGKKEEINSDEVAENKESNVEGEADKASVDSTTSSNNSKPNTDIKKFTKVLTAEEKAQQLKKEANLLKAQSSKSTTLATTTKSNNPQQQSSSSVNQSPTVKKRVPLLMSVARGQTISTPDKNIRISQFLKNINEKKETEKKEDNNATSVMPMETDTVVVLD